jgi:hypothetical protein
MIHNMSGAQLPRRQTYLHAVQLFRPMKGARRRFPSRLNISYALHLKSIWASSNINNKPGRRSTALDRQAERHPSLSFISREEITR